MSETSGEWQQLRNVPKLRAPMLPLTSGMLRPFGPHIPAGRG